MRELQTFDQGNLVFLLGQDHQKITSMGLDCLGTTSVRSSAGAVMSRSEVLGSRSAVGVKRKARDVAVVDLTGDD